MTVKFSPLSARRTPRAMVGAFVGLAIVSTGLTACDNRSSIAFEVGDKSVTIAELDKVVAEGKADPTIGSVAKEAGSAYRLSVLSLMLQSEITDDIAESAGIDVSDTELDAYEETLFGGSGPAEVQATLLQQGRVYTLSQLEGLAKQFFIGSELAKQSAGKTEQELIAEAITAAKKSAADAAKQAQEAGPTYALTYINLPDDAAATEALGKLTSGEITIEELGKTLDPVQGQDGTAAPQPSQTSLPESQVKTEVGDQFAVAKVGAFIKIGDASRGFIILRIDSIEPPAVAEVPSDAELQEQAEQSVGEKLTTEGQTAAAKASQKLTIWVNPRLGTLERPTESLPSIATVEPATFKLPAAEQSAADAADQAEQQQQTGA